MMLKKVSAILLAISMTFSSGLSAKATEILSTEKQVDYFIEIANDDIAASKVDVRDPYQETYDGAWSLYEKAVEYDYVSLDDAGRYVFDERTEELADSVSEYEEFLHMFDVANQAIELGLCGVDPVSHEIYSVPLTRDIIERALNVGENSCEPELYSADNHGCSYPDLYLGGIVSTNYDTIRDFWDEMIQLSLKNPNIYPKAATIGFWVGKIQEGGEWDYKVKPGYKPYDKTFCCTYGENYSKQWVHRTSEFIGNYNYGYTGELLFSLSVLKKGSDAAAGDFFNPDSGDYPAITEGYNDASDIE